MSTGFLPILSISPLKRIAPSRFLGLRQCALRELWVSSANKPQLPISPRARVGTVVHRLLQDAGNGKLADEQAVKHAWESLISNVETVMLQSAIERPLVPLRVSVRDFQVLKLRALRRAASVAEDVSGKSLKICTQPGLGSEVWVQTSDGIVGGSVDLIYRENDEIVIRDYKSGLIVEEGDHDNPVVKDDYLCQIKLYSALYFETFGKWPGHAELMPITGEAFRIAIDPEECSLLLASAKQLFNNLNAVVLNSAPQELEFALATPKSSNCRWCLFRPACQQYRRAIDGDNDEWSSDVIGRLSFIRPQGNGRYSLVIEAKGSIVSVRQITGNSERHPSFPELKAGENIGVFCLRLNPDRSEGVETNMTTIYRMS